VPACRPFVTLKLYACTNRGLKSGLATFQLEAAITRHQQAADRQQKLSLEVADYSKHSCNVASFGVIIAIKVTHISSPTVKLQITTLCNMQL